MKHTNANFYMHWCKDDILVVGNCFNAYYIITKDHDGLGGQTFEFVFIIKCMVSLE